MPSTKPKVFAYLPQELYDRVSEFKAQHQYPSDSQALIAILTEFFDCPKPKTPIATDVSNALEQRVGQLERMFDSLNLMVLGLLHAEPLNDLGQTNGSVPGEPLGELEETNGSVPGKLARELEETNGSVLGELEETNGSVLSEPLGEPEETSGSVLGELEETNGSVLGEPLEEPEETNGSVPGEPSGELEETNGSADKNQLFVMCLVRKDAPTYPTYWVNQKIGFTSNLDKAKTYKTVSSLRRHKSRLSNSLSLTSNEHLNYKTFGQLKEMEAKAIATNE